MLILVFAFTFLAGCLVFARWNKNRIAGGATATRAKRVQDPELVRFPIRFNEGHLIVNGDWVWTVLRHETITDEHFSQEEFEELVDRANGALTSLAGNVPVHTMTRITHRPFRADQWAEDYLEHCWDPTPNYVKTVYRQRDRLEMGTYRTPEGYFMVRVARVPASASSVRYRSLEAAFTGVADEQFSPAVVAEWTRRAEEIHETIKRIGFTPATRADILWLIKKPLHGHLTPGSERDIDSLPWGRGEFRREVGAHVRKGQRHLELTQPNTNITNVDVELGVDEHSYVAHLMLAKWPSTENFDPQRSLLRFCARNLPDVEVASHETLLPTAEFAKIVDKWLKDLEDEIKDCDKAGQSVPEKLAQDHAQCTMLRDAIANENVIGVFSRVILQVSAPTVDELERRVRSVENTFKQDLRADALVIRPSRCQPQLLSNMIPGDDTKIPGQPMVRMTEVESLSYRLPSTGSVVGDRVEYDHAGRKLGWRGAYLGMTATFPYFSSPNVALARRGGAGILDAGGSGNGKTTYALLAFHLESESGVECYVIDPKIDFAAFVYYLCFGPQVLHPDFDAEAAAGILGTPDSQFTVINERYWRDSAITDVTRGEDGSLDAYANSATVGDGDLLAHAQFQILMGPANYRRFETILTQAIGAVHARWEHDHQKALEVGDDANAVDRPTNAEVVRMVTRLREEADASDASYEFRKELLDCETQLVHMRDMPQARLFFSDRPRVGNRRRLRRNVYTLRDISSPEKDKPEEQWERPERYGAAIIYTLTHQLSRQLDTGFETNPRTGVRARRPKLITQDEANVVMSFAAGRQLARKTMGQGRSYNTVYTAIDQQLGRLASLEEDDASETAGNQVSTVVAFRHRTPTEARRALPLLGRQDAPHVANELLHLPVGSAIVRDLDGRTATVWFDTVFTELLHASDTSPDTGAVSKSHEISADVDDWSYVGAELEVALEAAQAAADEASLDAAEDDLDKAATRDGARAGALTGARE